MTQFGAPGGFRGYDASRSTEEDSDAGWDTTGDFGCITYQSDLSEVFVCGREVKSRGPEDNFDCFTRDVREKVLKLQQSIISVLLADVQLILSEGHIAYSLVADCKTQVQEK